MAAKKNMCQLPKGNMSLAMKCGVTQTKLASRIETREAREADAEVLEKVTRKITIK